MCCLPLALPAINVLPPFGIACLPICCSASDSELHVSALACCHALQQVLHCAFLCSVLPLQDCLHSLHIIQAYSVSWSVLILLLCQKCVSCHVVSCCVVLCHVAVAFSPKPSRHFEHQLHTRGFALTDHADAREVN